MIHRFIIPGIIVGALHGGVFLIPSPPAPIPVTAAKLTEVFVFDDLPKIPPVPIVDPDVDRGNDGRPDLRPVSMIPQTLTASIENTWTTPFVPDLPQVNVDTSAMNPGIGDITKRGIDRGDGFKGLIDAVGLDKQPRTVFQIAPEYPPEAKHNSLSGTVTVMFRVDENGDVHDARVVNTSDAVFNDAALRAVVRWRFEPGLLRGKRVAFRMSVPIAFNLSTEE